MYLTQARAQTENNTGGERGEKETALMVICLVASVGGGEKDKDPFSHILLPTGQQYR